MSETELIERVARAMYVANWRQFHPRPADLRLDGEHLSKSLERGEWRSCLFMAEAGRRALEDAVGIKFVEVDGHVTLEA